MAAADFPDLPIPEALHEEAREAWDRIRERAPASVDAQEDTVLRLLAASPYAASVLVSQPDFLAALFARSDEIQVPEGVGEDDFPSRLRRTRNRELLRILCRDVFGLAGKDETLRDLSVFASRAILAARDHAVARTSGPAPTGHDGDPVPLLIVGLGKLGGAELNFSSDIDLIFSHPVPDSDHDEAQVYFTRMCQRLIRTLHDVTADGFVYRVDMRLRPFGSSGALALSIDAMETYYQLHGRDWERYALLKGRILNPESTGAKDLKSVFLPFVYRRSIDFRILEELRSMKTKMEHHVTDVDLARDVKHGPGGIREAEFIVQSHQLVFGGKQPGLQQTGWMDGISALVASHHLDASLVDSLRTAYRFLRRVENHLQMARDQQVHILPEQEEERERLRFSLGYPDWNAFLADLDAHREILHREFTEVLGTEGQDTATATPGDVLSVTLDYPDRCTPEHLEEILQSLGIADAGEPVRNLLAIMGRGSWKTQSATSLRRSHSLVPDMTRAAANTKGNTATTLCHLFRVLEALLHQPIHIALLNENPEALHLLAEIAGRSSLVITQIEQSPMLLDELLNPRTLFATVTSDSLEEQFLALNSDSSYTGSLERQMQMLRNFQKSQVLRVAVSHVLDSKSTSDISDELGWIAEIVTRSAWEAAQAEQIRLHGAPHGIEKDQQETSGAIVLAYGKLGGLELGFSSDLDLVFVHDSVADEPSAGESDGISYEYFFARVAQGFTHIMECTTAEGRLYQVDTRLRPDGTSGQLVCSLSYLRKYLEERAWIWEHQALIRARAVAGDADLAARFEELRTEILCRERDGEVLRKEFIEMRERMLQTHRPVSGHFHLKSDRDGVTDIEFLVHYNVLLHAHAHPELIRTTPTVQILERFAGCGLLDKDDADFLRDCYFAYRNRIHELSLQEREPSVDAQEYASERARVRELWDRTFPASP